MRLTIKPANRSIVPVAILAAAALLASGASIRKTVADDQTKAAQQIRTLMEAQVTAWNNHDLEGFMTGYWNSPELTFYSGPDTYSGWQAAIDRYRKRYQGEGKEMGHLDFTNLQVESLGPDSAFVRGRWHLKFSVGDASGVFTLIFKRFPNGWKIIHDHTS